MSDKFDNNEPLARNRDDRTSHDAGNELTESGARDDHKALLRNWMAAQGLVKGGAAPLTNNEIERDGKLPLCVHKRMADLKNDGWVVKDGTRTCTASRAALQARTWRLATPEEYAEFQARRNPREPWIPGEQTTLFEDVFEDEDS
jgi:hypothetical protein